MTARGRKTRSPLYSSTGLAVGPKVIETVRLAMTGLSTAEIANRRGCSRHNVSNQLKLFYDVAKQLIDDDAFWKAHAAPERKRQALPLIWERTAPYFAHLIADDDVALSMPRSRTVSAALADLPAARCRAIWGRDGFIDDVCQTLRQPRAQRIVLLAALGGYGKTECARAVAELLLASQRFANLVWIDLNSRQTPFRLDDGNPVSSSNRPSLEGLARTMLSRLSCASEDDLRRQLQAEATLVVLDGLESVGHQDRAAVVDALHRWLGNGPSQALITSRVDVVAPYVERPVFTGLDLASAEALLRGEAAHASQAAQLRDAPASVIERVWQLTLGMPLALHLVIGQCQHYELRQVVAHLEDARAHGSNDAFYAFLNQPAWQELRRAARALLVFMAIATRAPQTSLQLLDITPVAGIMFDQPTLHDALAELSTWFLAQRALPQHAGDEPTYALHPTTRGFVQGAAMRERWAAELGIDENSLLAAATRKHEDIFALTIGEPDGEVGRCMTLFSRTVLDQTLARAVPDVLHVMRAHHQRGDHSRVRWYWESISGYLWYFGRFQEFVECDEYALAAAHDLALTDPAAGQRLIGIISAELGFAAMELDEPERATGYFRDAVQVFDTLRDGAEMVRVLRYQATLQLRIGDFTAAERLCREALQRLDLIDWGGRVDAADEPSIMRGPIHNLLGSIYLDQQRHDAARREIVLALRVSRRIRGDHRYWSLSPTVNLGRIHEQSGRLSLARRYYQRCLSLTEDGSNPNIRADALVRLASFAGTQSDPRVSRQYALEAISLYEAMGKRADATRTRQAIAARLDG